MKTLIRECVREMKAYHPPLESRDPTRHLLLDFNERSETLPPELKEKFIETFASSELQVYPSYGELESKVADYVGVGPGQVMLTNGSDQGIDIVLRAVCSPGDKVFIPSPAFPIYGQCAQVLECNIITRPYSFERGFPYSEAQTALESGLKLMVIPNPNNPTGTGVSLDWIAEVIDKYPATAFLIDECYFEYSQKTSVAKVSAAANLFIARTFSKTFGLAALRIGYLVCNEDNISQLKKIRFPYDVNAVAAKLLDVALDNKDYVSSYVGEVIKQSKPLLESKLKQAGIRYWPSEGNFLLIEFENPKEIHATLQEAGILVRPKENSEGRLCLRITLGSLEQTNRLLSVLFPERH